MNKYPKLERADEYTDEEIVVNVKIKPFGKSGRISVVYVYTNKCWYCIAIWNGIKPFLKPEIELCFKQNKERFTRHNYD